jgi:hypothetical protein
MTRAILTAIAIRLIEEASSAPESIEGVLTVAPMIEDDIHAMKTMTEIGWSELSPQWWRVLGREPRCYCDEIGDGPCPAHHDEIQNYAAVAWAEEQAETDQDPGRRICFQRLVALATSALASERRDTVEAPPPVMA